MTDGDINGAIREAMWLAIEARKNRPELDQMVNALAAGLAAAVRLLREPALPEGWCVDCWYGPGGTVRNINGAFFAYRIEDGVGGGFPTLAAAIAAVEKARHVDR